MNGDTVGLTLTPQELTSTIEALHDGLLRRTRWATSPDFLHWRNLDIGIAQIVIDSMTSSYTKAMMVYRETDMAKLPEYEEAFLLPDDVFDMLAEITKATSWDQVPYHRFHKSGCNFCDKMPMIP
jgi:hypothetical protein